MSPTKKGEGGNVGCSIYDAPYIGSSETAEPYNPPVSLRLGLVAVPTVPRTVIHCRADIPLRSNTSRRSRGCSSGRRIKIKKPLIVRYGISKLHRFFI